MLAEGVDWTMAGAAVIVASSVYIAHRELRLGRRRAAAATD